MHEEVIIAGSGGQGILFMGDVLAWSGIVAGKWVTWLPSYGPEMRGGTARCSVILSDEKIGSPVVEHPDTLIAMNSPSLQAYISRVKPGGLVIINKSLIGEIPERKDIELVYVNANLIAGELGNPRVANVIMLGAYAAKKEFLGSEKITKGLSVVLSESGKEKLIEINKLALERGAQEASAKI